MAKIDNSAYNYFLQAYGDKLSGTRFDSHKREDLEKIYNRIVRKNRSTPVYKITFDGDVKNFAIDLKEQSRSTLNLVSSITEDSDDIESVFYKKIATSSNEDAVKINYIGSDDADGRTAFTVGVDSLALPQVNTGNYLPIKGNDFEEGTYSFDLSTPFKSYEFEFNVSYGDTNREVQSKIARLVNSSNVGLSAKVVRDGNGNSALQLTSKQTGLSEDEKNLFSISSDSSWNEINKLGIANITQPASNSRFSLNGKDHSSLSNTFTINQEFEITLSNTTPKDRPAVIGFKANTDAIADSVSDLLTSYNGFIAVGEKYSTSHSNNQLLNEVHGISMQLSDDLKNIGVNENPDDGTLSLDREKLADSVTSANAKHTFKVLNKFKDMLTKEAGKTSIDPLNYVDKITVEYKNPKNVLTAPYASSIYAGLLLDYSL